MDDLISRKAAIEYLMTNMGWCDEDGYQVDDADEKRTHIEDLMNGIPSASAVTLDKLCERLEAENVMKRIKALRDWADGMAMPGRKQLVNEAADCLEELYERIAIMEEGNTSSVGLRSTPSPSRGRQYHHRAGSQRRPDGDPRQHRQGYQRADRGGMSHERMEASQVRRVRRAADAGPGRMRLVRQGNSVAKDHPDAAGGLRGALCR